MRARDVPGLYTWSYPDWYLAASLG
eukprot:gene16463-biopygen17187